LRIRLRYRRRLANSIQSGQDEAEAGKKDDPKTGSKRPADDGDDDDGQEQNNAKKQKISPNTTAKIIASFPNNIIVTAQFLAAVAQQTAAQAAAQALIGPNPVLDTVAPVGVLSPNEAHVFRGSNWIVRDFEGPLGPGNEGTLRRDWVVQQTDTHIVTPFETRILVCAVNAVLGSIRLQYPNDPAGNISEVALLQMLDQIAGRRVQNDAEDNEVALLVDLWAGGRYNVVVVSDAYNHNIAHRIGTLAAQRRLRPNLYVHHIHDPRGGSGHWSSMRRRRGPPSPYW
jgi:hypothetical protein